MITRHVPVVFLATLLAVVAVVAGSALAQQGASDAVATLDKRR